MIRFRKIIGVLKDKKFIGDQVITRLDQSIYPIKIGNIKRALFLKVKLRLDNILGFNRLNW